ncbi:MAG: addiction module protein [Planctomycetes bacterium]|nr:addiction module protein [Planctomycetota bacterium]
MSPNIDGVLSHALALSSGDRIELVEAILASLRTEDRPPFDESWREVILRRSADLESGKVSGVPWREVKAKARGQAGG